MKVELEAYHLLMYVFISIRGIKNREINTQDTIQIIYCSARNNRWNFFFFIES